MAKLYFTSLQIERVINFLLSPWPIGLTQTEDISTSSASSILYPLFRPYGMVDGSLKMVKVENPVEPVDKTLKPRSQKPKIIFEREKKEKNSAYGKQNLSTDADSSTDTKKILLLRKNKLFICAAILHPLS